ncbi:IS1634 family transposase [Limnochorda pilosa]|uniref:Transposase n=1 Tax=Limnochorda pilosa TaxID=1555112 RepID=A0A0K2SJV5_LIMPI|nr:IS1634 family transposase [Limnochorda pilosa]BAS27398.1 transposase [Limnochorda pilosa]
MEPKRERLVVRQGGAPVLLARVCRQLRIRRIVNAMVEWDPRQCKVSPGTLVVALILNMLVAREPLYTVKEFYRRRDLGLLFEEPVEVDALNDDALGRTLDRLAAIDLPQLVQSVGLSAVHLGEMEVRSVHADTTSVSVYGEFEPTVGDEKFVEAHPEKRLLKITHGHSKQRRPDLKQFISGLIVSKQGVPLMGTIGDGNLSDKVWNREMIESLERSFLDPRSVAYVVDSSLVTVKNLQRMDQSKVRFISRLPETFKAAGEVRAKAFVENRWQPIGRLARTRWNGAFYHAVSYRHELAGGTYRLTVVRSSSLDKRKEKKLERLIRTEQEAMKRAAKELMGQRFNCQADAEAALAAFQKAHEDALHTTRGLVVAYTEEKRPRGRPRKDAVYPKQTHYQVEIRLFAPSEEAKKAWLERESAFVLISNLPEDKWSDAALLEEYKGQTQVEQGFRVYKHPIVDDGIFLKSTRRVEAFAYVATLALMVAAFLEYRVRQELQKTETKKLRLLRGARVTDSPTSLALLEEIDYIPVLGSLTPEGYSRYADVADDLPEEHLEILRLAGFGPEIYFEPLVSN